MYAKINNKVYNIEDGPVFSEEYNETLDSGIIKIGNVEEIIDLKPYDDVFIYNDNNVRIYHFLVNNFTENMLTIGGVYYNYIINLFSETKGLEVVQLPNVSVTEPLKASKKISIYTYASRFVELYSPKVKVTLPNSSYWRYENKYILDTNLASKFGTVYSPDFTLNNPNLKDLLTKLFITKDCLPYVKNNIIYALDITVRNGIFNTANTSYIYTSRDSTNHADNLKRTYNGALSQDYSASIIENMGLRNSDTALMTIGNMRLESILSFYKVNKVYACYFKKVKIIQENGTESNKMFLCKQDISKLVLLNSERNLLSLDWADFKNNPPTSIEEMAQYKLCTVGYDIGSNYITGWGTKYTYPEGWWDTTKTYLENILELVDGFTPYGIYSYGYITNGLGENDILSVSSDLFSNMISPATNNSLKQKTITFEVDYNAFYNGTVIHSKDKGLDNVTINDNSSSSLTLLEEDGLFQKEKLNRFGNKAMQITARYNTLEEVQELGSVYGDDNIIYSRDITVKSSCVDVSYLATKDYVLKNYFTSVYAKHRPYNLMSYGESIRRSENKKQMLLLSKQEVMSETEINLDKMLTFIKESDHETSIGYQPQSDKINYGYISFAGKTYACDVNGFVTGNSLCFNLSMYDNVSAGVYIKTLEPSMKIGTGDDFTGSVQDWYLLVDDKETGNAKTMGFFVFHMDKASELNDKLQNYNETAVYNTFNKLFAFPRITLPSVKKNLIGYEYNVYKDNKDVIDMTYQIEPISDTSEILFSSYFMKLSDLLGTKTKVFESYNRTDNTSYSIGVNIIQTTAKVILAAANILEFPMLTLKLPYNVYGKLTQGMDCNFTFAWSSSERNSFSVSDYVIKTKKVADVYINENGKRVIEISSTEIYYTFKSTVGKDGPFSNDITVKFIENEEIKEVNEDYDDKAYIYLSNLSMSKSSFGANAEYTYETALQTNSFAFVNGVQWKYNKYFATENWQNGTNCVFTTFSFLDVNNTVKYYNKNMIVVSSNTHMKKTIVYDEPVTLTDRLEKVTDIFSVNSQGNIVINNTTIINKRSVQLWYYENGSYHFVFGVNQTSQEMLQSELIIYTGLVTNRDKRVYGSDKETVIGKTTIKNQYNMI